MDAIRHDLTYTLRRLWKRPTYAALTVLTLALGVAGTAALFSITKPLLLEPLPVPAEDEVVVFWMEGTWSEAEFSHVRSETDGFRSLAAFRSRDVTLQQDDTPARLVEGVSASSELFDVLGVSPAIGPGFQPADDRTGAEPVALLSHTLWQSLGGRTSIVGETVDLAGEPRTVVGVMPEGFWFPDPTVQVWLSEEVDPENHVGNYGLIGRMPPGRTIAGMGPVLDRTVQLLDERFEYHENEWDLTRNPQLTPLREYVLGSTRPALLAVFGAMVALLVIASANVAALMLGQVDSRETELAVRRALGAGRKRLLQQLLVEALVIGALSGAVGAGLAVLGFPLLLAALPLGELAATAAVDWTVFAAAMGIALFSASSVALVPGVSIFRRNVRSRLARSRTGSVGGRGGGLEKGLVVAQVALVLLLAGSAGLLIRSVGNLRAIDPGVDTEGVAVVDLVMPVTTEMQRRPQIVQELIRAVEASPDVESAAAAQRIPLRGSSDNWGIAIEGRPALEGASTAFRIVTPEYFRTMGIRVVEGRGLLESDRATDLDEGTVVVNEALADRFFPDENPIGQRIAFRNDRWDRIVGVVENAAESDLSPVPVPARYMTYEQVGAFLHGQTMVLRARDGGSAEALLDPARRAIQDAAPEVAVRQLTTMKSVLARAIGPSRHVMSLLTLLSGLGLALGTIGVYGVVSHFVTRRKRDWGIRIALGMRPSGVVRNVVSQGAFLMILGIALGLAALLALTRLLSTFLYEVGATDPVALAAATTVLLSVGLLAAYLPARRASHIDPAGILRDE